MDENVNKEMPKSEVVKPVKVEPAKEVSAPDKPAKKDSSKYPAPLVDPWKIVFYPFLTEKSIGMVEEDNKLIFIVRRESNKREIRWAIEKILNVKVKHIQTLIDRKGRKKAFIKLTKDSSATDIATRFGML
jgi:large subunit ribosomal protein L23